jgi:hypothetical protein
MRVGIGTGHGGFNLNEDLVAQSRKAGHDLERQRSWTPRVRANTS